MACARPYVYIRGGGATIIIYMYICSSRETDVPPSEELLALLLACLVRARVRVRVRVRGPQVKSFSPCGKGGR